MATDPVLSAMEALRAHLATNVVVPASIPAGHNTLSVRDGWPEWSQNASSENPLVALTAADPAELPVSPVALSHDSGDTIWRTALLEWLVQLDLWVPYKAHLGPMLEALSEALDNLAPASSGLELTQSDYHGLTVRFRSVRRRVDQDQESAPTGAWRARITLRATCSKVRLVTTPIIEQLDLSTTYTGAGAGSESVEVITPS